MIVLEMLGTLIVAFGILCVALFFFAPILDYCLSWWREKLKEQKEREKAARRI